MIVDKIIVVRSLDKRQVEWFSNYSAYQEWLMERTNPLKKPFLVWKFSQERSKEVKLEKKYELPQFLLRGVLYYLSYEDVKGVLSRAAAQQQSLSDVIQIIRKLVDFHLPEEPYPIKLPIRVVIPTGDEVGSLYNFGDYDSYLNWRLAQSNFADRLKILRKDSKHRKQEIIFEAKFRKPPNYFRGIFDIDYVHVVPMRPISVEPLNNCDLKNLPVKRQRNKYASCRETII
jgi:hypothetical protein